MLFNSLLFLFGFLPAALAIYALAWRKEALRCWTLIALSLVFYGWWDVRFVPLLVGGIAVNWLAAWSFFRWQWRPILILAMAADLAVLGWFKYINFLLATITGMTGLPTPALDIVLPLGISFFTFHHIIYLADCWRGRAPLYSLRDYGLYIVLFPQILAGPLVRHSEIVHQFHERPWRQGFAEQWSRGFVLITIGLAKKVLIADSIVGLIDPIFAAAGHQALSAEQAWIGALGFTFQIYFDFSGYSDMAIGLALLLGFTLPENFDAPYRAKSLQEFWRRWHMTLSRFLRDYLYIPLGGNRRGLARQLGALMATMLLGGLWHGAGWHFVVWGAAHGLGLAGGVLWRLQPRRLPPWAAGCLTFLFVVTTWVFFRAPTLQSAGALLQAMLGGGDIGFTGHIPPHGEPLIWAALVAFFGPTSQEVALSRLKPYRGIAVAAAAAMLFVLYRLGGGLDYQFIYFQF